jgi:integrase
MATVRKATYTVPIPTGAKLVTKAGKRFARFKRDGELIDAPLTADGQKCRLETEEYYIRFKDLDGKWKREKGYTDKRATEEKAHSMQTRLDQRQEAVNPHKEHHERPLSEHLDDWRANMLDQGGASEGQVKQVVYRARRIIEGCGFKFIPDLRSFEVEAYLAKRRANTKKPMSAQTSNHYLQAVKRFAGWLVKKGRTDKDRLADVPLLKITDERRVHDRRALTQEEFSRLVNAAERGPVVESVPGPERAMLYIVAGWTGYRRAELASLTLRSFILDGHEPTVSVKAGYTKNGRTATVPLHPVVVERLRAWLETRGRPVEPGEPIFELRSSGGWWRDTARMMHADLAAARKAWIEEVASPEDQAARERSDFLTYQDENGAFADFHANRHTFITNLGRAGVSLGMAQKLARHSDPKLTANIYTHLEVCDQAAAIQSLPAPPATTPTPPEEAVLRATGTDDLGETTIHLPSPCHGTKGDAGGITTYGEGFLPPTCQEPPTAGHDRAQTAPETGGEQWGEEATGETPQVVKRERLGMSRHAKPQVHPTGLEPVTFGSIVPRDLAQFSGKTRNRAVDCARVARCPEVDMNLEQMEALALELLARVRAGKRARPDAESSVG